MSRVLIKFQNELKFSNDSLDAYPNLLFLIENILQSLLLFF